jgi:hypothetical protein
VQPKQPVQSNQPVQRKQKDGGIDAGEVGGAVGGAVGVVVSIVIFFSAGFAGWLFLIPMLLWKIGVSVGNDMKK